MYCDMYKTAVTIVLFCFVYFIFETYTKVGIYYLKNVKYVNVCYYILYYCFYYYYITFDVTF